MKKPRYVRFCGEASWGGGVGWSVRIARSGPGSCRFFSDSKHGGKDAALVAAKKWGEAAFAAKSKSKGKS